MNYKVLYRKYRPNNFENIVGQDYITKTLKNSIVSGNVSHAYIFSGPRGTGKTSTAKVFAKAINCLDIKDGSPCDKCDFCKNYHDNPDIIEIDAASHNGVDQIRELIDNIKLTPTNAKYKIYIIDEVHMLTTSAFNALLLSLEEPPSHVIFVFATTNIESVPITILSRTQRFDFRKISDEDMFNKLREISEKENISIDDDALIELASLAEGGLRDALSLLDQLSKNDEKITLKIVEQQVKTISYTTINEMINFLENNDIDELISMFNEFSEKSIDYKVFIKKMVKVLGDKAIQIKRIGNATTFGYNEYKLLIYSLIEALNKININVDPFTIIKLEMLSFMNIEKTVDSKKIIIKQNEILNDSTAKRHVEDSKNESDQTKNEFLENDESNKYDSLTKIRINNCFSKATKACLVEIKDRIDKYVHSTKVSKNLKSILLDASPVAASEDYTIFEVDTDHHATNLNSNVDKIENELQKYLEKTVKIIFIDKNRWQKEKKVYITNLKNNVGYKMIDEKKIQPKNDEILSLAANLFAENKIEII